MKRITAKDITKLHNLYLNGDYNSFKIVWSQLSRALEWLDVNGSLILEETQTNGQKIIEDKEEILDWVRLAFPDIYSDVKKGNSSILNDDDEFPKFKQQVITIESLSEHLDFKLIKKLTIWGQKIKLKQTFQRIEYLELKVASNTIEFRLSNNAYLQIVNDGTILNSGFSLIFQNALYIELGYAGTTQYFKLENENKVKIPESTVDVSSIYLNAIEIQK